MKVLYIMSSYNIYGGTPKKTLDLMKYFGEKSSIYVYHDAYPEFKQQFVATGGKVYEGFFGRNVFKHLRVLLLLIDQENINIVQTQFSMGETLGFLIKLFRPEVKLLITFESGIKPTLLKSIIVNHFYKKMDAFVYISNYVKSEKVQQFPKLKNKITEIIFNGTERRVDNGYEVVEMSRYSLFDISALIDCKNIQVLIEALNILIKLKGRADVFLYVAGEGTFRKCLGNLIIEKNLENHVHLLGNQKNIGKLLDQADVFVHPSYNEGFGIAVAEAMYAEKPIIVANAGALPELIEHEKSGLIVSPHNALEWADAILRLIENSEFAKILAKNAKKRAEKDFNLDKFVSGYEQLYKSLIER